MTHFDLATKRAAMGYSSKHWNYTIEIEQAFPHSILTVDTSVGTLILDRAAVS